MNDDADPLAEDLVALSGAARPRDTRRSLPIALLRAREAVMARFRPMLAQHDINEQQWRVIRVLCESGELDATELAERALVLAPSLTRMLKSLKTRKLIVMRKDKNDGRRTLISNTPAAQTLIEAVAPESTAIYRDLEQGLGKAEMERLLDLLESTARL
ncbi:MAG: homoprotocatechuate degradation operon regulator HpaR [Phyllobacteriaceae bacterium]|nr:homoprotocatechuate degradation operon regulator HpaR [Phyllobacteriaceae bacterium]